MNIEVTLTDIEAAARRIAPYVLRTPVLAARGGLNELGGAELFFKCENLQRCGAFKFRGAVNALRSLPDGALANGVATHSSGNHAAALALAARLHNTTAHVVMPENASRSKIDAVRTYGAEIHFCEPTQAARERRLAELVDATGAHFVPPYDDWRIVAGQGTAALELCAEVSGLQVLVTPIGGGGLTGGSSIVAKHQHTPLTMIAAEPAGADDAFRSLQCGRVLPSEHPQTIADGLRSSLSERTFAVVGRYVDDIITVDEAQIIDAMRLLWTRMKLVVEPSSAVALAAVLARPGAWRGRRIGIILTGGNVDLDALPW